MTENSSGNSKKVGFLSIILDIYVVLIGVGLPLVTRDMYFDILPIKYYYFLGCTILMVAVTITYLIAAVIIYLSSPEKKKIQLSFKREFIIDIAVLIYYLIALISTLSSDYLYESFWGNEGRFTGLFLITWYVISYFLISRFWRYKRFYIDLILGTGILVCLFGITDYFNMDIFHFKADVIEEQKSIFVSTIGNINTYTSYVGIIVAIATTLFTTVKERKRTIYYYICMVIGFFAIIMGVSDNAYLSLGALFGFLPLYLFSDKKGIQRYLIVLATFLSVIQIINWINICFEDRVLGIESAFNMLIGLSILPYLLVLLWGISVFWYTMDAKKKSVSEVYGNKYRYAWLVLVLLLLFSALYTIYDCNVQGNTERYGKIGKYILFNDDWGTNRGYIWRNAIEVFRDFSLWKKLIGFGPETFGILLLDRTYSNPYNQIFDNAHNEYLQLLLTIGIVGLMSYLIFIISTIKIFFNRKRNDPFIIAIAFSLICYSVQAFVNLGLPIVTPVFWLLLGMGRVRTLENNK